MKTKNEELKKLIEHIESYHNGDYIPIIIDLSRAIYMLHYVDKDDVGALKIQNTCFELYNLIECFYEAYQVRQQVA
ncbi:MAG: hypothetical protein HRT61_02350 [Ekhidna sp.]|nr:hypothetical protein [Ekhidna sp.]